MVAGGSSAPVAPSISAQPVSTSVVTGTSASFSVTASGDGLSYQWQLSSDGINYTDIATATGASYTTPATATTDSGKLFRVHVSNSVGNVFSNSATLTVASAPVAPVITTQPVNQSVTAPATATFTVTATGTPTPTYQWQLSTDGGATFNNISGATSASYTTPATVTSGSGKRFRVLLGNTAGTAVSALAQLTVTSTVSLLSGRAWTIGQSLESDDNNVLNYEAGIDDAGAVTALFTKSNGTRTVLYATRGTPGAAGSAPTFSAPAPLDAAAPIDDSSFKIGVAPGGNAVAAWNHIAPCTASTYNTFGNCNFHYVARYIDATGVWEAPLLVGSNPGNFFEVVINDRGDVMLHQQFGWIRSGGSGHTNTSVITWRSASQGVFREQTFAPVIPFSRFMSNNGDLLVVASATQNSTTDIVAYRGNVNDGLGAQEILDTRLSPATLVRTWSGTNGQAVVFWLQNDGTGLEGTAATLDSPTGAWTLAAVPSIFNFHGANSPNTRGVVTDSGDFILYTDGKRLHRIGGVWSAMETFSAVNLDILSIPSAVNRDGSVLQIRSVDSAWSSLDGPTSLALTSLPAVASGHPTGPGYIYGVASPSGGKALLSKSGVGALISKNTYDILPTPTSPAGDFRNIANLWGFYFK